MRLLCVCLLACLPAVATAQDKPATVTVGGDGTIVGRMEFDATEAEVRAAVPGLVAVPKNSNILDVKVTPDGTCHRIFRRTRGLWEPLEMYTRLCPTAKGWRELLVTSDDYDAYEVEYSVAPKAGGGSELSIIVKSSVDLPVPSSLVQAGAVDGVKQTFAELLKRLFAAKRAP